MKNIYVIGGGAAGLAAAISAARTSSRSRVTILEGLEKAGKKLLATGNGRCNLTNTDISASHYHTSTPKQLARFVPQIPFEQSMQLFHTLNLPCDTEEMGRVYPHTRLAVSVRNALLNCAVRAGVTLLTEHKVSSIRCEKEVLQIVCENGARFTADAVILTAGGKAAPKQGTDGSGFDLAKQLGHHVSPLYPCLTAFRSEAKLCKGLKGIRAHGRLTLNANRKQIGEEYGEIQFTDYGISGIPAFQLSCLLKPGMKDAHLYVDLLPDYSDMAAMNLLREYRFCEGWPIIDALPQAVHPKLMQYALNTIGIPLDTPAEQFSYDDCLKLVYALKHMHFPVTGVQGWEHAQVTGGGVMLTEINDDFSSRLCPHLWLAGEVLDVAGDCGGYNLHWAWCSGIIAGESAAK